MKMFLIEEICNKSTSSLVLIIFLFCKCDIPVDIIIQLLQSNAITKYDGQQFIKQRRRMLINLFVKTYACHD